MDDPVTPLLAPFTYQALIHEVLEIRGNAVRLPEDGAPLNLRPGDWFWAEHADSAWPEVAEAAHLLGLRFRALTEQASDRNEDARTCQLAFAERKALEPIVETHLKVCDALMPRVKTLARVATLQRSLVDPTEQGIAGHLRQVRETLEFLEQEHVGTEPESELADDWLDAHRTCRLRVLLLFALQYQDKLWTWPRGDIDRAAFEQPTRNGAELMGLCSGDEGNSELRLVQEYVWRARQRGLTALREEMKEAMAAAARQRQEEQQDGGDEKVVVCGPFATRPVRPRLAHTLQQLAAGQLPEEHYPRCAADESTEAVAVPRSAIVFVLGGVTYEEARLVHALNMEAGSTTRVTLGGEFVTSARQFLRTLG